MKLVASLAPPAPRPRPKTRAEKRAEGRVAPKPGALPPPSPAQEAATGRELLEAAKQLLAELAACTRPA
jgi:transcription-repair coupling factor (superfamily II helicase)